MQCIPTQYEGCSHCSLVGEENIREGRAACGHCGATARVVPGESYARSDLPLFDGLAAVFRHAQIEPADAAQAATEMRAKRFSPPGFRLKRLVQLLPSLGVLDLV